MAKRDETWSVQDARAHFGDVIDAALKGRPQRVTRRGKDAVVIVSEAEWRRVARPDPGKPDMNLGAFLATFPLSAEEWQDIAPRRHRPRKGPFSDADEV